MKPEWVIIAIVATAPVPVLAQQTPEPPATDAAQSVEEIMARGRELYRAPGVPKPCNPSQGNEIVVCRRSQDSYRTDSTLDDAIRDGKSYDEVPRAPDLVPPCPGCKPIGGPPPRPLIIDLYAIPEPLDAEDATRVHAAPAEPIPPPRS